MNMIAYDKTIVEAHKDKLLRCVGHDFEAWQSLVKYRKHRAYLAWALMCIVDVVHKQDVLHNDLNSNNVMLHFPKDRPRAIFIGICDWGMVTWIQEEARPIMGRRPRKIFESIGQNITVQPPNCSMRQENGECLNHLCGWLWFTSTPSNPSPIQWGCWQRRSTGWIQLQSYFNEIRTPMPSRCGLNSL